MVCKCHEPKNYEKRRIDRRKIGTDKLEILHD